MAKKLRNGSLKGTQTIREIEMAEFFHAVGRMVGIIGIVMVVLWAGYYFWKGVR